VSTVIQLTVYVLAIFGLLTAVGIGPAIALGGRIPAPALMAPALGLAILAAVLVSLSYGVTMSVAAWLVLAPLACASVLIALLVGRHGRIDVRELAIPIAISVLGLVLGCLPAVLLHTTGPTTLAVLDVWGYIPADLWLQHHTATASMPPGAVRYDLISSAGHYWMTGDQRIGSMAVSGALASLLQTSPDETHLAFLTTLYAMVPCSIWVLARAAGAGRLAAGVGAAFGLSPTLLMLVFDSTEANLIGLALAPLALLMIARAAMNGSFREAILAAVLVAGLIAAYPEYLLPYGLVSALAIGAATLGEVLARRAGIRRIATIALRGAGILALALAVTPLASDRMRGFLPSVRNVAITADLPDRWLTISDFGAWLFGILNLYQLPRFDLLSPSKTALAIALPVILTAIIIFGLAMRIDTERAVVAAGLIVPLPLGLYVYSKFQDGHCQYCMWKSFTFMLPFLGAGVALGTERVLALASRLAQGVRGKIVLVPFAGIALVTMAAIGNANIKLIEATYRSAMYFPTSLRKMTADAKGVLPHSASMLLEGSDSAHNSAFSMSSMYYAAHEMNDPRLSFDVDPFATYEIGSPLGPTAYYSPRYQYVLTAFAGIDNGRRVLVRHSNFALERRAPIDVAITHTGWALDPREGAAAIPWVSGPFTLRISSTQNVRTAITIKIRRPLRDHPMLQFLDARGRPVRTFRSQDGSSFCAVTTVTGGQATLRSQLILDQAPPVVGRATETDPLPAPGKAVGIAGIRATVGGCSASLRPQPTQIIYGKGWFASEPEPPVRYRWMGTDAAVTVGEVGVRRKVITLETSVISLALPRRLTVTLMGRVIARITAPARSQAPFTIRIPAGKGVAQLELRAAPAAASASQVTPGDMRVLAIRLREFSLGR
jgi:hypothetical protein